MHDAANSIATIVSTRVLTPRQAVIWAAFFNFVAFLIFGTAVAHTIGEGMINLAAVTPFVVFAGLLGAISWSLLTWLLGLPTSSSHAIIGAYAGAAVCGAGVGVIISQGWVKTIIFIFLAPILGMILGGSRKNIVNRFLMLGTVRTSHTDWLSAEGITDPSCEGKWGRLDELPLVFDEDSPVMCRERSRDVLPFQFTADEIFCAVELDRAVAVDLPDERYESLGDGKGQTAAGIEVGFEREAVWEMLEGRPKPIAEDTGEPGPVVGKGEASAGLLEVVIAEEAAACSAQGPQVRTAVKKNTFLPQSVKAFHGGVASGLSLRDEQQVDPQQEMEPDRLGEAVTISPSSGGGHLVVHLRDPGPSHNTPGINEMAAEREGLLVRELAGRGCLPDGIDGVKGIEPGNAPGTPQVSGPDQVGLLKVAHPASSDGGIRRSTGQALGLDLFRLASPGQDLFDGRDGRKLPETSSLELEVDCLSADAGKRRSAAFMGRQLVADGQDLADERLSSLVPNMFGGPAPVPKPRQAEGFVSFGPLGQPPSTSTDGLQRTAESPCLLVHSNRFESDLIFPAFFHRSRLLPNNLGRSLGDEQKSSRCPYGFLVYDVLMETR